MIRFLLIIFILLGCASEEDEFAARLNHTPNGSKV